MIVAFRNPWHNHHEHKLYPRNMNGVEVSDEYKDILPSSAKILSAGEVKKRRAKKEPVVKEPDTLSELSKTLPDQLGGV